MDIGIKPFDNFWEVTIPLPEELEKYGGTTMEWCRHNVIDISYGGIERPPEGAFLKLYFKEEYEAIRFFEKYGPKKVRLPSREEIEEQVRAEGHTEPDIIEFEVKRRIEALDGNTS